MTHPNIEHVLTNLYRAIESETINREFVTDDAGVSFLAGSQTTDHVWIAFRIHDNSPAELSNHPDDDGSMTFRVIRLQPDRSESFGISRRTGQMEKQSRFDGCRYMIGDVHVRPLTQRENFGTALRQIQERFHDTAMRKPLDSGQIMGPRALTNLYFEWVADHTDN